jgi:ATP-dependent RNA circularization protein (DNA/RNA ligase family)
MMSLIISSNDKILILGFPCGYKKLTVSLKEDYGLIINHKMDYYNTRCRDSSINYMAPEKFYPGKRYAAAALL